MKYILTTLLISGLLVGGYDMDENGNRVTAKALEDRQLESHFLHNGKKVMVAEFLYDDTVAAHKAEENRMEKSQASEAVEEAVFLNLLEEYNGMFERIEADIDFGRLHREPTGFHFKTIQTKEELYEQFSDFMTAETAETLWGETVAEGKNGLYLIPMDGHPKFNAQVPYTIETTENGTYQLISKQKSELYGIFETVFTFQKQDSSWKIADVAFFYSE